jgi:hypothetical protein
LKALSGYISGTCYADPRLADEMLNQTFDDVESFIFISKSKNSLRVHGNLLLINSKTIEGEKALILRAVNPTEGCVRRLGAARLFTAITAFARQIARERGDSLVAAASSDAFSNRVGLCDELHSSSGAFPRRLSLIPTPATSLNSLVIHDPASRTSSIEIL